MLVCNRNDSELIIHLPGLQSVWCVCKCVGERGRETESQSKQTQLNFFSSRQASSVLASGQMCYHSNNNLHYCTQSNQRWASKHQVYRSTITNTISANNSLITTCLYPNQYLHQSIVAEPYSAQITDLTNLL